MKTQLILKIAVVAMAAFGAYAFSGNNASNSMQLYSINEGTVCTDILAECSNSGDFLCEIFKDGMSQNVLGLACTHEVKHELNRDVDWVPAP